MDGELPQLIGDAGGIEQLVAALSVYEDEVLIRPQGQLALFYLAEHETLYPRLVKAKGEAIIRGYLFCISISVFLSLCLSVCLNHVLTSYYLRNYVCYNNLICHLFIVIDSLFFVFFSHLFCLGVLCSQV